MSTEKEVTNKKERKQSKRARSQDSRVGIGKLALWQSSSVSVALSTLVLGYVTIYCTDTLMLPAALVGTIFMVSKLIDGVTDILAGFIIDRTQTRWGKGRPYEIFMLFLWLSTWLLFSTPTGFSTAAKCVWLFFMYVFMNAICKTFLNGNNVVYLVRAFKTKEQQVRVTAYGSFFTMGASLIFSVAFPILMARMATSAAGWSRLVGMLAIPMTILGLLRMLTIPEKYNNEDDTKAGGERLKLKDVVTLFRTNPYLIIVIVIALIYSTIGNMGVAVYYWTRIVGNVALMGITSIFSIVGLPMAFLLPRWHKKYGLAKMSSVGFIVAAIGYFVIFFVKGNVIPLVICILLTSLGAVPYNMMGNIFVVELGDYNEWKGNHRMEGTMGSLIGLPGKIGSALGGFILGLAMTASGYDGALEVEPDSALLMIRLLMSFIPAIAYVVIVLLFHFYRIDDHRDEIDAALARKRGQLPSPNAAGTGKTTNPETETVSGETAGSPQAAAEEAAETAEAMEEIKQ